MNMSDLEGKIFRALKHPQGRPHTVYVSPYTFETAQARIEQVARFHGLTGFRAEKIHGVFLCVDERLADDEVAFAWTDPKPRASIMIDGHEIRGATDDDLKLTIVEGAVEVPIQPIDVTITLTEDGGTTKCEDARLNRMLDEIEQKAGPR